MNATNTVMQEQLANLRPQLKMTTASATPTIVDLGDDDETEVETETVLQSPAETAATHIDASTLVEEEIEEVQEMEQVQSLEIPCKPLANYLDQNLILLAVGTDAEVPSTSIINANPFSRKGGVLRTAFSTVNNSLGSLNAQSVLLLGDFALAAQALSPTYDAILKNVREDSAKTLSVSEETLPLSEFSYVSGNKVTIALVAEFPAMNNNSLKVIENFITWFSRQTFAVKTTVMIAVELENLIKPNINVMLNQFANCEGKFESVALLTNQDFDSLGLDPVFTSEVAQTYSAVVAITMNPTVE